MHYVDQFLKQILKSTKKNCILYLPNNTFMCYKKIKENIEIKNLKLFQKLRIKNVQINKLSLLLGKYALLFISNSL